MLNLLILQFLTLHDLQLLNSVTASRNSDPINLLFFVLTLTNSLYYEQPSAALPISKIFALSSDLSILFSL